MYLQKIQTTGFDLGICGQDLAFGIHNRASRIKDMVADFYGIPRPQIDSPDKRRVFVRPRQIAMYLARKHTRLSLPEIGRRFGGRDHTTVIHALKTIERLASEDSDFRADMELLSARVLGRTTFMAAAA